MTTKDIRRHIDLIESASMDEAVYDPDSIRAPEPDWAGIGREFARESNLRRLTFHLKQLGAKKWQAQYAYHAYYTERAKLIRTS